MFNFMETLFALSLGITFLLMLLLIYHFKQRLSAIEQKHDILLEIINTLVQETHILKSVVAKVCNSDAVAAVRTQRPSNGDETGGPQSDFDTETPLLPVGEGDDHEIPDLIHDLNLTDNEDEEDDEDDEDDDLEEEDYDDDDISVKEVVPVDSVDPVDLVDPVLENTELVVVADEPDLVINEIKQQLIIESPLEFVSPSTDDTETLDKTLSSSDEELSKLSKVALRDLAVQRNLVSATDAAKLKKPELIDILLQK